MIDLSLGVIDPRCRAPTRPGRGRVEPRFGLYPEPAGDVGLRVLLGARIDEPVERIGITCGASGALAAALASRREFGEVLIPCPGYAGYRRLVSVLGVPWHGYALTLDESPARSVHRALETRTGAATLVVADPGNPLGTAMSEDEVQGIVRQAADRGVTVILDQAYHGLVFDGPRDSARLRCRDGAICISSLSKGAGLAGLRLGYVCADESVLDPLMEIHSALTFGVSMSSQSIAREWLDGFEDTGCARERGC